jgi:hypothetical protein
VAVAVRVVAVAVRVVTVRVVAVPVVAVLVVAVLAVAVEAAGTVSAAGSVVEPVRVAGAEASPLPHPDASSRPATIVATAHVCLITPVSRTHRLDPIIRPDWRERLKLHRLGPKPTRFWQYIKSRHIAPSEGGVHMRDVQTPDAPAGR